VRLRLRLLAFSAAALALGTLATGGGPLWGGRQEKPRYDGTLRVKAYLTPFNPSFDPTGSPHYFIVEQLFDGLVKFDTNFGIVPALAEYWTISADGKKITFYLRKGVRFHNGRELTADDVKFSLERLVEDRPGNTCYEYFTQKVVGAADFWEKKADEVRGFVVRDPYTFEIEWTKPYVSGLGLSLLSMYYCKILPKDLVQSQGRGFFQKPVGTGPFKFAEWLRSPRLDIVGVRLERNAAYFGKHPYLAALEYSPYYTEGQFEQGSVHIFPVTSDRLLRRNFPVLENDSLRLAFLAMSCGTPPLDQVEVRRALALGISKARLAAAAYSASYVPQLTENFIPPILPGFFPRVLNPVYEPEKARMLLTRLLPETAERPLTLTLVFVQPRKDIYANVAKEFEREMKALGVNPDVKYLRKEEDIRDIRGPYLKFLEWSMAFPDPENIVLPLFHSGSTANQLSFNYANPEMDRLIEQSEVEPGWEKRNRLFRKMESLLFQDLPGMPLYSERVRIVMNPMVRGAKLPALGFFFLDTKNIWLED